MSDTGAASEMLVRLEALEARKANVTVIDNRSKLAARLKTTAGTLANIRKERRKTIPAWLMRNIGERLIVALQSEIRALEHEIENARQIGLDPRDDAFSAAEASLASARVLIKRAIQAK